MTKTNTKTLDSWMTAPEAALALKLSRQRVVALIRPSGPRSGPRLVAVRKGRLWLVTRASVDARLAWMIEHG